MKHSVRATVVATFLVSCALAVVVFNFSHWRSVDTAKGSKAANSAPVSATVESTGQILGVGIGCALQQAHEKLDPLRDPFSMELREKEAGEDSGEKAYWRLKGTEYSWIMVWTNKQGQVVQLSAAIRPEKAKPFTEIGNLSKAAVNLENAARWNARAAGDINYQLVAKGPNRTANNIYMIATTLKR